MRVSAKAVLRVPVDALWEFMADTERMNRAIGLPAVRFVPLPVPGHYRAEARSMGVRLEYEEFPFNWVERRYYSVLRRFARGPILELVGGVRIAPAPEGSEIEVFGEITPRNWIGALVAHVMIKKKATRDILEHARAFERHFADPASAPPAPALLNADVLASRSAALKAGPVEKLRRHLETASDLEVVGMRPYELADRWGEERRDVLSLFLQATPAGVLDLSWHVLCPSCRAAAQEAPTLAQMRSQAHCATCDVRFGADLASSVEVRFAVNAAVRAARRGAFCIGGPANTPHIVAQLRLSPGESRREDLLLKPGPHRVRCYQAAGIHPIPAGPGSLRVRCGPEGLSVEGDGSATLEALNALEGEALLVIERESWREGAATAAQVVSLQEFRDLFPAEAVAAGEEVGVSSLAFLFTDLTGSTALYRSAGETRAFGFVQSHFAYLTERVRSRSGAVVKTMGDAVMASFARARDALEAAAEMQRGWEDFRRGAPEAQLKIGVHQGPAIAIGTKGRLDFYGTTVNTAARLQGEARGGEVVFSQAVRDDPEAREFLASVRCEQERVALKGLDGEQTVYRMQGPLAAEGSRE